MARQFSATHELARYSFIALAPYDMLRFAAHEAAQGLAALQEKLAAESAYGVIYRPRLTRKCRPFAAVLPVFSAMIWGLD